MSKNKNAVKLGSKTCLIELKDLQERMKVMENKAKLKDIQDEKIYIYDDRLVRETFTKQ